MVVAFAAAACAGKNYKNDPLHWKPDMDVSITFNLLTFHFYLFLVFDRHELYYLIQLWL